MEKSLIRLLTGASRMAQNGMNSGYFASPAVFVLRNKTTDVRKPPPRPGSAFSIFVQKSFKDVAMNNPGKKATDLTKVLGQMWKSMDDVNKKQYITEMDVRKNEYQKLKNEFESSMTDEELYEFKEAQRRENAEKRKRKLKRLAKSLDRPSKESLSGYNIFFKERSEPGIRRTLVESQEMVKRISRTWAQMSDADKEKYKRQAQENKLRYDQALESWEMNMIDQGLVKLVRARLPKDASDELKASLKNAKKFKSARKKK